MKIAQIYKDHFPISLDVDSNSAQEETNSLEEEIIYTNSGSVKFYTKQGISGYILGTIDLSDTSLKKFIEDKEAEKIVASFYMVEAFELIIENCLDPNEDYEIYEMGIIINNEFYDLEHEKNCSWKIMLEKKDDILSFKTLLFSSDTSNKRPLRKTFNLNELEGSGRINECIYNKTDNFTLLLNC